MLGKDELRAIVARHFRVYDAREEKVRGVVAAQLFYVMFQPGEFDARFEAARSDIRKVDPEALVFLRREGGEDILFVADRPMVPPQRLRLHLVLLLLTIVTTTMAGALYWEGYHNSARDFSWMSLVDPENLMWGSLTFALPLMLILGLHETAHYVVARRHGLRATLPFFIPVPPFLMPIGTLGAFISLRDPLPDRKALFDVGASGPLAGFLVALPVVFLGAFLTGAVAQPIPDIDRPTLDADAPHEGDFADTGRAVLTFGHPANGTIVWTLTAPGDLDAKWAYTAKARVKLDDGGDDLVILEDSVKGKLAANASTVRTLSIPLNATEARITVTWDDGLVSFGDPLLTMAVNRLFDNGAYLTHPTAFAGWVGLLVTGINLLPASQLDGGHVARAVLGERMKYAAYAAVAGLIGLALFFNSWVIMALFILMMGIQHPPPLNDRTELDLKRKVLAVVVLVVFVLTFVARPIIA